MLRFLKEGKPVSFTMIWMQSFFIFRYVIFCWLHRSYGYFTGTMLLTFYHYKRCSTCVKARKFLIALGHNLKEIDITTTPPSSRMLASMIKKSGRPYTDFLNRSGVQYREQNIKEKVKSLSEAQLIRLVASEGRLIKRPIVTDGIKVSVGFKEAEYEEMWSL